LISFLYTEAKFYFWRRPGDDGLLLHTVVRDEALGAFQAGFWLLAGNRPAA
jgi:hypothetical protein